jgi:hypothetical protein
LTGDERLTRFAAASNSETDIEEYASDELAELEGALEEKREEIEDVRARELSGPLQLGCALFGLFGIVLATIVAFILVAKDYFGGWLFYLCLGVAISLWVVRVRRNLAKRVPSVQLQLHRRRLEAEFAELEAKAARLRASLKEADR